MFASVTGKVVRQRENRNRGRGRERESGEAQVCVTGFQLEGKRERRYNSENKRQGCLTKLGVQQGGGK